MVGLSSGTGRFGGECVFEGAQSAYLYLDAVSALNGAYAGGSSGGNNVARLEGHGGGDVAEKVRDREDEVGGDSLLFDLVVEASGEGDGGAGGGVDLVGD